MDYETTPGPDSPATSIDDDVLNGGLDYANSYGAQFDFENMQYDMTEHVGVFTTQIEDPMLTLRRHAAVLLRDAEDYVALHQRGNWLDRERAQRPALYNLEATRLYLDSFALGSDNDLDVNPFLWAVERLHGHQCI